MADDNRADRLRIIHFNDVYNIDSAPKFVGRVKQLSDQLAAEDRGVRPLVLFSGDCFSPSIASVVTHGQHMPPVLNELPVACACVGNHDLDFGVVELERRMAECHFPWLLSNARDVHTHEPLAGALVSTVLHHAGWRVGLVGLVEWEWMQTLRTLDTDDVEYDDFVDAARALAARLRDDHRVDIVVALTHMRRPNDARLAEEAAGSVDLVLGGHDHDYWADYVGGTPVAKSGTDFRQFTLVTVARAPANGAPRLTVHMAKEEIAPDAPEDPATAKVAAHYQAIIGESMHKELGHTLVPLDATFASIRTGETNIGNWICDLMRDSVNPRPHVAILNSGTLRADRVIGPGTILMRDLMELLPMVDETLVLEVTGAVLVQALENGVSLWPRLEGRFPQVSGIKFKFDPTKPPGSRIVVEETLVGDQPIDLERKYSLLTKSYLGEGKDGYDCLADCPRLVECEMTPPIHTLVKNYFTQLAVLNNFVDLPTRHETLVGKAIRRMACSTHLKPANKAQHLCDFALNPRIEGRIAIVR